MRAKFAAVLLLLLITAAVYAPVARHGFTSDDFFYVSSNEHVRAGLTTESIAWALRTTHMSNWHPVTWLSHLLDASLWGVRPAPMHLVSLALHMLNTLLLLGLLVRMTGAFGRSLFIAALFALHPQHVESVVWIAERKDLLYAFFLLAAGHGYLSFLRARQWRWYLATCLLFALGLMSKAMIVPFPFLLLLLDWWPLSRWGMPARPGALLPRLARRALELIIEKAPLFVLAAASLGVTSLILARTHLFIPTALYSPWQRVGHAALNYLFYLYQMVWPVHLALFRVVSQTTTAAAQIAAVLALLLLTFLSLRYGRRYPFVPMGWLWFLTLLLPVIGLVQFGSQSTADRYTYLSTLGPVIILVWGFSHRVRRGLPRLAPVAVGLAVIAPLIWRSAVQVNYWRDNVTLFEHAVEATEDNWMALDGLGRAYYQAGRFAEALPLFQRALSIEPMQAETYNYLGSTLEKSGRYEESLAAYRNLIALEGTSPRGYEGAGSMLTILGRIEEANESYRQALRLDPGFTPALYGLANNLRAAGDFVGSIELYRRALRLKPDLPEAWNNLGMALYSQGDQAEAIHCFREALRVKPDFEIARTNLEKVLRRAGGTQAPVP